VTVLRVVLCALAAVLGLAALVLAHDVHAWRTAIDRGDARYATNPVTAQWEADTLLPEGAALRSLGLRDDLRLRRAEQGFARDERFKAALYGSRLAAERRAAAQLQLADVVVSGSSAQASRAGNLLGILAATTLGGPDPTVDVREANAAFDAAVRADLGNADAKHNLELLLRRMKVIGTREGVGGSSAGDYGQALAGAGAGLPGSGY